ncbi:lytic transglycosylase domain-containing protein [Palleronia rufa]|uniref:lytic transglycosylase domain-containing protein n=2 Tax=Palleronia rufa TaxID=1530186 RepID=UPI000AF11E7D
MIAISGRSDRMIRAAVAAVVTASTAAAQGVPVIDGSALANAISRVEEHARDFGLQTEKLTARSRQAELHEDQRQAYARFLEETTGAADLSGFEDGAGDFASAAETYPAVETHPDAERLFGEDQDVERMIITVAQRHQGHPGVAAGGLNPLTWRILFQSLIKQESRFNNAAVSHVGARGFCQLMPGTASDLGVDPRDPWQNLDGGARYILAQLEKFGRVDHALAAYNAGPGRVIEYGGIPPFEETQTYVRRIRGYYEEYLGQITSADMTGSLAGFDGASAAWGNWSDASVGYGGHVGGQVDQAMGRIAALLDRGAPSNAKEAVDLNTYMLGERARLMALTLRLRAAHAKVDAARGLTDAADALAKSTFWRFIDEG